MVRASAVLLLLGALLLGAQAPQAGEPLPMLALGEVRGWGAGTCERAGRLLGRSGAGRRPGQATSSGNLASRTFPTCLRRRAQAGLGDPAPPAAAQPAPASAAAPTQALPYTWTLWFVPMHFLTHELLLFATAVWTTNIHDCLHGKVAPIMGAGYHTIHHTTYKHNYGHYTTLFDGLFGTLVHPEDFAAQQQQQQRGEGASGKAVKAE